MEFYKEVNAYSSSSSPPPAFLFLSDFLLTRPGAFPGRRGGGERELDVLLGIQANHERRNVDELLANPDVTLLDQHAGVVVRLGHVLLEDDGLEATVEELLDGQTEHIVELGLGLVEDTEAQEAAEE